MLSTSFLILFIYLRETIASFPFVKLTLTTPVRDISRFVTFEKFAISVFEILINSVQPQLCASDSNS